LPPSSHRVAEALCVAMDSIGQPDALFFNSTDEPGTRGRRRVQKQSLTTTDQDSSGVWTLFGRDSTPTPEAPRSPIRRSSTSTRVRTSHYDLHTLCKKGTQVSRDSSPMRDTLAHDDRDDTCRWPDKKAAPLQENRQPRRPRQENRYATTDDKTVDGGQEKQGELRQTLEERRLANNHYARTAEKRPNIVRRVNSSRVFQCMDHESPIDHIGGAVSPSCNRTLGAKNHPGTVSSPEAALRSVHGDQEQVNMGIYRRAGRGGRSSERMRQSISHSPRPAEDAKQRHDADLAAGGLRRRGGPRHRNFSSRTSVLIEARASSPMGNTHSADWWGNTELGKITRRGTRPVGGTPAHVMSDDWVPWSNPEEKEMASATAGTSPWPNFQGADGQVRRLAKPGDYKPGSAGICVSLDFWDGPASGASTRAGSEDTRGRARQEMGMGPRRRFSKSGSQHLRSSELGSVLSCGNAEEGGGARGSSPCSVRPFEGNDGGPGISTENTRPVEGCETDLGASTDNLGPSRTNVRGEIAGVEDACEFRIQGKLDKSVHKPWQTSSNDDSKEAQLRLPIQSRSISPRPTEFERRRYDYKMQASTAGPEVVAAGAGAVGAGAMDFFSGADLSPTPKHGGARVGRGVRRPNRYATVQPPPWSLDAA